MATTKALELGQFGTDLTVDDSTGAVTIANTVNSNTFSSTGIDDNADQTVITIGSDESVTLAGKLNVNASSTGQTPPASANLIVADSTANNGMAVLSGNTSIGSFTFGDTDDAFVGGFRYRHADDELDVYSANSLAFTFGDTFIRTLRGTIKGPSTMILDPSPHDPDTDGTSSGTVRIYGDLIVDGNTTTINSTTLTVDDLNIVLASGAADSATADGAGITIDGANATLTWNDSLSSFSFNNNVDIPTGILNVNTTGTSGGGKLRVGGLIDITTTSGGAAFRIFDGVTFRGGVGDGGWTGTGDVGDFGIYVGSSSKKMPIHIGSSTPIASFTSTGLGIGTDNPSTKLEVDGEILATTLSYNNGTGDATSLSTSNLSSTLNSGSKGFQIITSASFTAKNASNNPWIFANDDGVDLYSSATKRVEVTDDGINVVSGSYRSDQVRHSIRPSLNLDFANAKMLDSRIVFRRASSATYYDGRTKVKAEENLHTFSNTFTSGSWQKFYTVVTDDVATAPDGTTTASFLREDSTGSTSHLLWRNDITTFADVNYSLSAYVKRNGRDIQLRVAGRGVGWAWANFDLAAGTTGNSGGTNYVNSYITDVGNGWYLCEMTATSVYDSTVGFEFALVPNPATNGEEPPYNGDGSSGVYIWNAQIEQNDRATAPVFTSSNPITKYVPKLLTAGLNTPRFDHNPDTGESYGLLIEEAVTNQLGYSADLADVSWTKIGTNVLSNYSMAPDGTHTADLVYATQTGADKRIQKQTTVNASTTYTASVFAKAQGKRYIRMYASNLLNNTSFDLQNGTVVTQSTTGAEIIPVGNGWYRCSVSHVGVNGAGYWYTQVGDDSNVSNTDTNPVNGVLFWGAQFEANRHATSYIATSTASLTKNADLAYIPFDDWYPYTEGGSFYIEAKVSTTSEDIMLLEATRGTTNVISDISITSATFGSQFVSRYLNSSNDARGSGDITAGQFFKYAGSWNNTSNYTSLDGGTVNAAANNQTFRVGGDRLYIGSRAGSSLFMNDRIKKFSFYTEALPGAELKALTEE